MSKTIGIDPGTNYSCMAVFSGDQSVIIPTSEGSLYTPSWVAFLPNGERLIGEAAKLQAAQNLKILFFLLSVCWEKNLPSLKKNFVIYPIKLLRMGTVIRSYGANWIMDRFNIIPNKFSR